MYKAGNNHIASTVETRPLMLPTEDTEEYRSQKYLPSKKTHSIRRISLDADAEANITSANSEIVRKRVTIVTDEQEDSVEDGFREEGRCTNIEDSRNRPNFLPERERHMNEKSDYIYTLETDL